MPTLKKCGLIYATIQNSVYVVCSTYSHKTKHLSMYPNVQFAQSIYQRYKSDFDNLPDKMVIIPIKNRKENLGVCYCRSVNGKRMCYISLNVIYDRDARNIEQTIVHEMIHAHVWLNNIKDTSSHGVQWTAIANRINAKYGFAISQYSQI